MHVVDWSEIDPVADCSEKKKITHKKEETPASDGAPRYVLSCRQRGVPCKTIRLGTPNNKKQLQEQQPAFQFILVIDRRQNIWDGETNLRRQEKAKH